MPNELLIAVAAGLTSMVGWGTADFFAKKTIDQLGDVATLFWAQLLGLIPLAIIFAFSPKIPQLNTYDPLFIVLLGIVSALSYIPLYIGFGKGKVSVLSPIFASYSVVVVILAAVFLGVSIGINQAIAIALVFVGILLMSIDPRELKSLMRSRKDRGNGVPQVLSAMLIYSFWLLFFDKFLSDKNWVFYLLAIRTVAVLALASYGSLAHISFKVSSTKLYKYLICIGLFDVLAFGALSYGYSNTTYIGIVTVLSACFSLPTMLLAYLFLKERISKLHFVAAGIIIAGVVLIALQ